MHRIDGAGHVNNRFVSEDPATTRPPTEITPEIMNAFQEELALLIEWAGIVLVKGDNTQLKQALLAKFATIASLGAYAPLASPVFSGSPTVPSAPQFNDSLLIMNTAFARRMGLQKSGMFGVAGATVLTTAHIGGTVSCSGTGGYALTLPSAASCPAGATLTVINNGTGPITVTRAGADTIYMGSATVTSITIHSGCSATFEASSPVWVVTGGSSLLPYSDIFSSSLAANGWKRYPDKNSPTGYFIEQWGAANCTANVGLPITWPLTFPNALLSVQITPGNTTPSYATYYSPTTVGCTLISNATCAVNHWSKGY